MRRIVRRLTWGWNPMSRMCDHIEWTAAAAGFVLAFLAIPAAVSAGAATQERLTRQAAAQEANGPRTVAVLLEDGPPAATAMADSFRAPAWTSASWTLPDQTTRAGVVLAEPGSKAGDQVFVWLDRSGAPAPPPMSSTEIRVSSAVTTLFVLAAAGAALATAYLLVRILSDKIRLARWESEWSEVEPTWRTRWG